MIELTSPYTVLCYITPPFKIYHALMMTIAWNEGVVGLSRQIWWAWSKSSQTEEMILLQQIDQSRECFFYVSKISRHKMVSSQFDEDDDAFLRVNHPVDTSRMLGPVVQTQVLNQQSRQSHRLMLVRYKF